MTDPPRITDDGERISLGLESISDDAPTPAARARAIALALWDDDPLLGDALRNQCALGRSNVPQVRRAALFFQFAHGLLLEDRELGIGREQALRSHVSGDTNSDPLPDPPYPAGGVPRSPCGVPFCCSSPGWSVTLL